MYRNLINPQNAKEYLAFLHDRTDNQYVHEFIDSTMVRWYVQLGEVIPVITIRLYTLLTAYGVDTTAVYLEHAPAEWLTASLQEGRPVWHLLPPPDYGHRTGVSDDAPIPFVISSAGELSRHGQVILTQGVLLHFVDFLNSLNATRQLRMSLSEFINKLNAWELALWEQKLVAENPNDIQEIWIPEFKDTDYFLVRLKTRNAYMREGALMRHCVSGYYGTSSDIWSLRQKSVTKPLATIEVRSLEDVPSSFRPEVDNPVEFKADGTFSLKFSAPKVKPRAKPAVQEAMVKRDWVTASTIVDPAEEYKRRQLRAVQVRCFANQDPSTEVAELLNKVFKSTKARPTESHIIQIIDLINENISPT